jgi:hypothetical protein
LFKFAMFPSRGIVKMEEGEQLNGREGGREQLD